MAWGTGTQHVVAEESMRWCSTMLRGPRLGRRLLVRTSRLSCKAETCRARWRLVVQGGDLLEKLPLSRRLVEEAPN
jgi:hypothetical protein